MKNFRLLLTVAFIFGLMDTASAGIGFIGDGSTARRSQPVSRQQIKKIETPTKKSKEPIKSKYDVLICEEGYEVQCISPNFKGVGEPCGKFYQKCVCSDKFKYGFYDCNDDGYQVGGEKCGDKWSKCECGAMRVFCEEGTECASWACNKTVCTSCASIEKFD